MGDMGRGKVTKSPIGVVEISPRSAGRADPGNLDIPLETKLLYSVKNGNPGYREMHDRWIFAINIKEKHRDIEKHAQDAWKGPFSGIRLEVFFNFRGFLNLRESP